LTKEDWKFFSLGMKKLLPITPGVIPFGLIMGTVASSSGLNLFEGMGMNFIVFAGASQLAIVELMNAKSPILVVVLTGFVINLRFMMYSASLAPFVSDLSFLKKLGVAYTMTDQSYAVSIVEFDKIESSKHKILFYMGTVLMMMLVWHFSTLAGLLFGNFAPSSISLDFAIPLAFMSIVFPLIKNKTLVAVALTSAVVSVLTYGFPYNLGLIVATASALLVGLLLTKEEVGGEE
jgi:predicted branched-subunit amino acid permease